jgi:hypothetical protein
MPPLELVTATSMAVMTSVVGPCVAAVLFLNRRDRRISGSGVIGLDSIARKRMAARTLRPRAALPLPALIEAVIRDLDEHCFRMARFDHNRENQQLAHTRLHPQTNGNRAETAGKWFAPPAG